MTNNIVYYESSERVGYRPQMFDNWIVGTKIMCDGVLCEIKAVMPATRQGIEACKQMMRNSQVHRQNLAGRRQAAAERREADREWNMIIANFMKGMRI